MIAFWQNGRSCIREKHPSNMRVLIGRLQQSLGERYVFPQGGGKRTADHDFLGSRLELLKEEEDEKQ